jgi:filamentous hemagglutinin family protein
MHAISSFIVRRCAALILCAPLAALANPTGGTVAAGAATITHHGTTTTVTQGTDRAVINWNDFNIGAGELTRFVQPGAQSAVLNRVTGGNPTQIFGRLEGNGRVFVLNPNGVLVGAGGVVQTQGFIASTLNVADSDFMAGNALRFNGTSTASVENLGRIDAGQGDAVLIAHRVRNAGDLTTTGGTGALAAGTDVLLAQEGDTRIWVKSGVAGSGGTGVDHSGTISAVQAELKAAGGNVYSLAVNSSGLVSARGVAERDGRIYLTSDGGNIEVSGALEARGAGDRGGELYVGGGYQGKEAGIANAANTTVTYTARLDVGGETDEGGKIVVWADGHTNYAGALQTGRAGLAEVSGKGTLDFTGTVNTRGGRLLLDPTDIIIDNSNFAALVGNPLLTGGVTLSATNDITYNTSNPIQSNYTLVWDAGRDVNFAPTSAFGSMGAGNNVDFQIYAGRDVNFGSVASVAFSANGKALIRAGRDINMAGSSTISFGSGGWILLSADTANSTPPANGPGKIVLDSTSNLNATKVQIFAVAPSQFINNGSYVPPAPVYEKWEQDINIVSAGSGLWFKSNSSGTFAPPNSPLLITANDFARIYGDPNPAFTARFAGFVNGDTPSVVTGLQFSTAATLGSNVGTYTITPFGASAPAYYNLSYVPGTLTVSPAPLTVTIGNVSRLYGDPNNFGGSASITGYKNNDLPDLVVDGNLSRTTTATAGSGVGTYPLNGSGLRTLNNNYTLNYVAGVLTVLPAPLVIKANDTTRQQGMDNTGFTASFTGFKNSETPAVVSGLVLSTPATPSSGTGTYPITPLGATAPNYAITYQSGSLIVTEPVQIVTTVTPLTGTGVVGSWSDGRLLATKTAAEMAGIAIMNGHISQALHQINISKATVMAESVQFMLSEAEAVETGAWRWGQANKVVERLLLYFQREWNMGPDATNYADFVHSLFPTWMPQLRELALTDPELRGWLTEIETSVKGALSRLPQGSTMESVLGEIFEHAALRAAYSFRSPDEKAIAVAAETYIATRQKELADRMASLKTQIAAQVIAEDPSIPHTKLEEMFYDVKDESGNQWLGGLASNKSEVFFETNSSVTQKWGEFYALQTESMGYQQLISGQSFGALADPTKPNPMIFLLKNLLDQGKIQIY